MTHILFRCDASLLIGSGHVMRCCTLARELQRFDVEITFLCRRQPGDLITLLEQEFSVISLPELPLIPSEKLEGRALYGAWLGCSQFEDASQSLELLAEAGINSVNWIVLDHYGLDAYWQAQLLSGLSGNDSTKLLVIDDLADRPHLADILLDQNFFGQATAQRYRDLLPPRCVQLLGPHYALLGPEYAYLHPLVPTRTELRRVLVFFGGVDSGNFTGATLDVLMAPELQHLAVDVVLGRQSQHHQEVAELVALRPNTTLHAPLPSLAGLIVRADLAIGAGGATTWERACLALGSLVTPIAENQWDGAQALEQEGCLILVPNNSFSECLRKSIGCIIADPTWLFRASVKSAKLVHGYGAKLISDQMIKRNG
jgi:UDP-2,4-diacetamido-2,4,6-trideoxy-beta-L-altropyranose hydrolase